MPLYEYHCPANGQNVDVSHGMKERFETWAEVCAQAKIDLGDTPSDSPVERIIGTGSVNNQANTLGKKMASHGERSKSLNHGPYAAPPRNNRW